MHTLLHTRRVILPVMVVCVAALILAGARFAAYPAFISEPDQVHIVITRVQVSLTSSATSRTTIFDRQLGSVASQIYAQLVSGRRIPTGAVLSCPQAGFTYYHYELTFSRAGIQTSVATSDARGCQLITLDYFGGGPDYFSWYALNGTSFWVRLHQLVGAPEPI